MELKREKEGLFIETLFFNLFWFCTTFLTTLIASFVSSKLLSILTMVFVLSFTAIFCFRKSFYFYKPIFKGIADTGENIYLFAKYTTIYELVVVGALAFLIGIISNIFPLIPFELRDTTKFALSASFTWLSCITNITKCMLEYTYTVWKTNHHK